MATEPMSEVLQYLRRTVLLRDGAVRTDGQLLKDYIRSRDEAAVAILVQRHGPMVWGVCYRVLGNYHDAEDAFQATFLVLVRRAASIASPDLLANWLYGVAHQTALKARASAAKKKIREKQVTDMPEPAAVDHDLWNDLQPLLDQELSRLPEIHRAVIVLCDLQGKTRKEAARHLGLSEGTVGSRLARARATLAKRLTGRGVTLSGGALAAVLAQNVASAGAPGLVVSNAIKAASLYGAGPAASAGLVSLKVTALAEGVLKAMLISKLKAVVAVVLLFAFLGTGATVLMRHTSAAPSEPSAPPAARERVANAQKQERNPELEVKASQDKKSILEGSKAGDRKELVPGIAFRWCPAGNFKMGEGDDAVDVELSKGFWLGETEVTQEQWQKLMGTSPWSGRLGWGEPPGKNNPPPKEGPDYSASYISYDDALSFCKKLTTQEQGAGRLPKSWKYSLPTEAQWEYACRAGTKTKFSFGDDESQLSQYAWFWNPALSPRNKTGFVHQVGLKKPNAWGLRDMHGNVWEWCSDWYASKRSGGKDPVGPTTPPPLGAPPPPGVPPPPDGALGRNRVVRGGSWIDPPANCTSANRFYGIPDWGNGVDGFRIAAVPSIGVQTPQEPEEDNGKEKEPFTACGKEVGGLQAGLGYDAGQKRAYRHGETVRLVLRVRNVSKKEVEFVCCRQYFMEVSPTMTDGQGKPVRLPANAYTRKPRQEKVSLAPGKEIELYELKFKLRPAGENGDEDNDQESADFAGAVFTFYGTGKFQIQYERLIEKPWAGPGPDPTLSKLATGKLELEIKPAPPPDPPPATNGEKKAKDDKENLQGIWEGEIVELAGRRIAKGADGGRWKVKLRVDKERLTLRAPFWGAGLGTGPAVDNHFIFKVKNVHL